MHATRRDECLFFFFNLRWMGLPRRQAMADAASDPCEQSSRTTRQNDTLFSLRENRPLIGDSIAKDSTPKYYCSLTVECLSVKHHLHPQQNCLSIHPVENCFFDPCRPSFNSTHLDRNNTTHSHHSIVRGKGRKVMEKIQRDRIDESHEVVGVDVIQLFARLYLWIFVHCYGSHQSLATSTTAGRRC
jgi:hypothetical protein